tara:strand:- start:6525 stop:7415 length:891 start_codon:yes stop_codon:yes gene_type:complete
MILNKVLIFIFKIFLNTLDKLLKLIFGKDNFFHIVHDFLESSQFHNKVINNKNLKFFCPSQRSLNKVKKFEKYEPETLNWINNFYKYKSKIIFWDIGAQLGLYSIYAATRYKNIEVISFEPSSSNLRILTRNISINSLSKKIKLITLPLSNSTSFGMFKETKNTEGQAESIFNENFDFKGKTLSNRRIKQRYQILGTTIDFLIKNKFLNVPNFIKIDVDGIEHLILEGSTKLLARGELKEILIETNPNFEKQNKYIERKLLSHKFKKIISTNANILRNKKYKLKFNETVNNIYKKD